MAIRILTDSASDMRPMPDRGLTVLPMTIRFGEEQYEDGVTLSHSQFYEKLVESDVMPTTSLISPYAFEEELRRAEDAGDETLIITLSGKLSGTWQSAEQAAASFRGRAFVVDSQNVSVGQHILVQYAMRLRDEGKSAPEIRDLLLKKREDVCVLALLDTLEYLKKGGRVSRTVAFAGGLLGIKPVLTVEGGEVLILGKARGSRQGNNMLVETIRKKRGIDFSLPVRLGYTGLSDALLRKYIDDSAELWKGQIEELPVGTIGGTIGTHAGPGAIAVAFFRRASDTVG